MRRKTRMIVWIIAILLIVFIVGFTLALSATPTKPLPTIKKTKQKPVVVLLFDSLMSIPLEQAIAQGKAPAFSFLKEQGVYYPDVVSSYPTMSVTIDSTILTGTYPDRHKVPGLIWFDVNENKIISYGSGLHEVWDNGLKNVAHNSILRYNNQDLSKNVQTIYEALHEQQLQSASINGLQHRGSAPQKLNVASIIAKTKLLPPSIEMNSPDLLSLGALSQYSSENNKYKYAWQRFGVNDQFSVNELKLFIEQDVLPSFTLVYLPDADAKIHKNGPDDIKPLEKADKALAQILNSYSSWEEALEKVSWIVLGDSGQSFIGKNKDTYLIRLNQILNSYTLWERKRPNAQLAIGINERSAYIYLLDEHVSRDEIVDLLKNDIRIQFIAWKEGHVNYVVSPDSDKMFTFSPKGEYKDEYNQAWTIKGNYDILSLIVNENDKTIKYEDYPDALARLHGALHSQEGNFILVDAKLYYEFVEQHSHNHVGGGAHGSLHKLDSNVPVIIAGAEISQPFTRLVDMKQWLLDHLLLK